MATREPPVELFYDPAELRPGAPRLYVWRNEAAWELQDEAGTVLSVHPDQSAAVAAALGRSRQAFSEILVRGTTGEMEWHLEQPPALRDAVDPCRSKSLRNGRRRVELGWHGGFRRRMPCRWRDGGTTIGRVPLELFYDPADLDPRAPRLRIRKRDGRWELWDEDEVLLGDYPLLPHALDAALARSAIRFSEILVLASNGAFEWSVHHNPQWMELARILNRVPSREREAAD
jgi:hypothetical protein